MWSAMTFTNKHGWIAAALVALALSAGVAVAGGDHKGHDHGPRRIAIAVTKDGFSPDAIKVRKGEKLVLVVTRKTDQTCAGTIVIHVSKDRKIERELPLDKPVEIPVTFAKSGAIKYACGMGHVTGEIRVE